MDFDLIVIGGGTAGVNAAKAGIKISPQVAIVEEGFAGTCLARGCAMHYVFPTLGGAIFDTMAA